MLHLCQAKYIVDLLSRVHMEGAKLSKSPYLSRSKLSKYDGVPLPHSTTYHRVVGALQYCTITYLDIVFVVNQLCQHMNQLLTRAGLLQRGSFAIYRDLRSKGSSIPKAP